ncbi:MAG: metalloregulator ArsR/SmtB family transcription factor [Elusimicrobiota bacterium]|jgi:ArsR family transcriptional regulator
MSLSETLRRLNAAAEPSRLRILAALSSRRMCVCELCAALGFKQSVMSQHLRVLRDCGLVEARKNGLWVDYALSVSALSGPSGKALKTLLAEMRTDETICKDRKASAKVNRQALCGDAPKQRKSPPRA